MWGSFNCGRRSEGSKWKILEAGCIAAGLNQTPFPRLKLQPVSSNFTHSQALKLWERIWNKWSTKRAENSMRFLWCSNKSNINGDNALSTCTGRWLKIRHCAIFDECLLSCRRVNYMDDRCPKLSDPLRQAALQTGSSQLSYQKRLLKKKIILAISSFCQL